MNKIYILLPVYNRKLVTELFIKCLCKQTFTNFTLILIDDGSTDETDEMVLSYLPNSIVLKGDGNLWWAGGLQKGYEWLLKNTTDEDLCLLINDDTVFDNKFLENGYNLISQNKGSLVLAQCFSQQNKTLLDSGVYFDSKKLLFRQAVCVNEINCLSTRGLFLVFKDFKNIGGFYPAILPHYLSDYEFTIRAYKKGYSLISSDKLQLYVNEETTGIRCISDIKSTGSLDCFRRYFSKRNSSNPFHWLSFILLAVPFPYKIYHFIFHILNTIKVILKYLLKSY